MNSDKIDIQDEKTKNELENALREIGIPGFAGTARTAGQTTAPMGTQQTTSLPASKPAQHPAGSIWFPVSVGAIIIVSLVLGVLLWKTAPRDTTVPTSPKPIIIDNGDNEPVKKQVDVLTPIKPNTSPSVVSPRSTATPYEQKERLYKAITRGLEQNKWRNDETVRQDLLQKVDTLEELGHQTHDKEAIELARASRKRFVH